MSESTLEDKNKQQFIQDVFLTDTIRDSIVTRRGRPFYAAGVSDEQKFELRESLKKYLICIAEQYKRTVSEEKHIQNIRGLMDKITQRYGSYLNGGCINFGVAQKALNCYLKYLWCNSQVCTPPHCPFDAIIISKLALPDGCCTQWTSADEDAYHTWIEAAKKQTGVGESLCEWELRIWNESSP